MIGPPGAGKTMLARRLPGILPPPSFDEALEITQVHSAAGIGNGRLATERPFRAPHHTISPQGLVGGGGAAEAGRDHARPPRRALPRRACPSSPAIARRRAAAAARGGARRRSCAASARSSSRRTRSSSRRATAARARARPTAAAARQVELRALPAAAQRPAAGPDRPGLPGGAGADRGAGGGPNERRARSAEVRARVVAARERQLAGWRAAGVLCNGDMDGRLTRRQVPLEASLAGRLLAVRDRIRAERARARPGAAGGADDRGPGRARAARGDRRRRGAVVPPRQLGADRGVIDSCARLSAAGVPGRPSRAANRRAARSAATEGVGAARPSRGRADRGSGRGGSGAGARRSSRRFDAERERERACRGRRLGALPAHDGLPAAPATSSPTRPPCCSQSGATRRSPSSARSPRVAVVGTRRASPVRDRGRVRDRARARGVGGAGRERPRAGDRRDRATAAASTVAAFAVAVVACGPDVVYPRRAPRPARARARERPRDVRAPARHRAVPLELPGPKPDHGRARAAHRWSWRPPIRAAA